MRIIFPLFRFTKFLLVSIEKDQSVLDKKKNQRTAFSNYCRLYIFKICALRHAIFSKKNRALLCFLDGFGIAVPVFSY